MTRIRSSASFDGPTSPRVIADVININNKGVSRLARFARAKPSSAGADEELEFAFDEFGSEGGGPLAQMGALQMKAKLSGNRIKELRVSTFQIHSASQVGG